MNSCNLPCILDGMNTLNDAMILMGGPSAFARELNATPQQVSNWRSRGVPAEQCPKIERITKGAVKCEELRPDVEWWVLRGKRKPK